MPSNTFADQLGDQIKRLEKATEAMKTAHEILAGIPMPDAVPAPAVTKKPPAKKRANRSTPIPRRKWDKAEVDGKVFTHLTQLGAGSVNVISEQKELPVNVVRDSINRLKTAGKIKSLREEGRTVIWAPVTSTFPAQSIQQGVAAGVGMGV